LNHLTSVEEQSSSLLKSISCIKVGENIYLKDLFIYRNINIWEVYEPIIAIYLLPQIISRKRKLFNKYIYLLKNILNICININIFKTPLKLKNYWLFPSFSEYMHKDTISPLVDYCQNNISNFNYFIINKSSKSNFSISSIFYLIIFITKIKLKVITKRIDFRQNNFSNNDVIYIIDYLLYNLIPKSFKDIESAIYLFKLNPPNVVVSIDIANPSSRIYTVLAKKYNILSIDLQYGHYESNDIEWKLSISDKIFVWGQIYSDLFEKNHFIEKEKIRITGSPKFDYIAKNNHHSILDKTSSKIKILFASTYTIDSYDNIENYNVINSFKNILSNNILKFKNIELYIKPHPLEDITWTKKFKLYKNIFILNKSTEIKKYISECKYFISFGSTSTFDAMLQNKICFAVNFENTKKNIDVFVKNNIVNQINNERELISILTKISKYNFIEPASVTLNQKIFLKNSILTNGGKSSSSHLIAKYIKTIIK